MSYLNLEVAAKLRRDTLEAHGYLYEDRDGKLCEDTPKLKDTVYQRMAGSHVVDIPASNNNPSAKLMAAKAVTADELYAVIFPNAPGVTAPIANLEESRVAGDLKRLVWGYTNTGPTGYVNDRVELEGLTLVMCEAKVSRTKISAETGHSKPVTEIGRFLTDHPKLIEQHSTLNRVLRLVKIAEGTAKHVVMALRRHPEIADNVARQIKLALGQAKNTLGSASTPPSLPPRDDDDDAPKQMELS
jgi:hypothetical protein